MSHPLLARCYPKPGMTGCVDGVFRCEKLMMHKPARRVKFLKQEEGWALSAAAEMDVAASDGHGVFGPGRHGSPLLVHRPGLPLACRGITNTAMQVIEDSLGDCKGRLRSACRPPHTL